MSLPGTPFPASDFNTWADRYDDSVSSDFFPFTGYHRLLDRIVSLAAPKPGMRVLDLGTGTGNLALLFAQAGCSMWCTDFSRRMLNKARQKLPTARFALHDLRTPLPEEFEGPFDCIVSAYVFHHFDLAEKVRILHGLRPHLTVNGHMFIGDVAFPNQASLQAMISFAGAEWEEEYYWVAEEALPAISSVGLATRFEQVSPCAGIFMFKFPPAEHPSSGKRQRGG